LDFDWILNSQDPVDPNDPGYFASDGTVEGSMCRVHVSRQRPDGKGEKIVPELKFEDGRWFFVNFHYPDVPYPQSENLLGLIGSYLKAPRGSSKPN